MKKKTYNENYFEVIDTEDKAYFLGLIFADGCVTNNPKQHRYQLVIKLHKKDVHILENFINSIEGDMDVWCSKKLETCQVHLSGKKIISDLDTLGVVQNKTFSVKYPIIDEKFENHFLRGFFDGDGCVRINTDKRDGSTRGDLRIVSGSVDMLNKINERMNSLFGTNINKLYGPKNKGYKFIGWGGMKDIENIYNGFYLNASFFFKRKKHIFDEVIEIIKNKEKYRKK
jgi:intein-encoded DNA endonuclease-like protein